MEISCTSEANEFDEAYFKGETGSAYAVPACETSLVWNEGAVNPALARFVDFARTKTTVA